jgi:hypothetical protein
MILPSDEDPRKDDDARRRDEGDDALPWANEPEPPGFFGEEETTNPAAGSVHNPAPPGWREDLREDLADALAELKEIEDPAEDFDPPEPPDLFTFYGELVAMRSDLRNMGGLLSQALPGAAADMTGSLQDAITALVKAHDELEETGKTFLPVLAPAIKAVGLKRVKVKVGAAFDPVSMTTDDKPGTGSRVAQELFSGWLLNGIIIRPAHVALK